MLEDSLYRNPFSDYNANTMNSEKITDFWENPFENYVGDITESEIASDTKPLVFTGGRGSGKTMILRYFELDAEIVRANKEHYDLLSYICRYGYVGLYIRFDVPLLKGFTELGLNETQWEVIFSHFFELTLGKSIVDAVCRLAEKGVISESEVEEIVVDFLEYIPCQDKNLNNIGKWFRDEINSVTTFRSERVFDPELRFAPVKVFASGGVTKPFINIIKSHCNSLQNVNFLVLLDEYENFLPYEQRIVNSILKFADNMAYRVGMRPMGFHTYDTVSENEFIKEKRDYRGVWLDNPLIMKDGDGKYIDFLMGIAEKRLSSVPYFAEHNLTKLVSFLGEKEDPVLEAKKIVKGRNTHFDVYIKEIEKKYKQKKEKFVITPEQLAQLKYPDNPLYEMQNLRLLLKPFSVDFVIKAFHDYISGIESEEAAKYENDYANKYKLAYVFVLRSIYRVESKQYYGTKDFAYLSSGIAGTFVELCRCTFQYAYFSAKDELFQGHISPEIQTKAARDVGKTELDQIKRISKVGNNIYNLAINCGKNFVADHVDKRIKYPETNQISFNSSLLDINSPEEDIFKKAVMWSVIQKKKDLQQAGIGKDDVEIFLLNRVFAPVFNISVRTRGGKNLELDVVKFRKYTMEETLEEIEVEDDGESDASNIEDNAQMTLFDFFTLTKQDGE